MTAHALKLSLGLLFEISNILSLGWGNSRTHFSEKVKNEKKNIDDHGSTHTKIEKEIKSQKKWSLKKKYVYVKNKKTNSSIVLPILFESRKEGCQCINV